MARRASSELVDLMWAKGPEADARASELCASLAQEEGAKRRGFTSIPYGAFQSNIELCARAGANIASLSALDFAVIRDDAAALGRCLDILAPKQWGHLNMATAAWLACSRGSFACMSELARRPEALDFLPIGTFNVDWAEPLLSHQLLSHPEGALRAKELALAAAVRSGKGHVWLIGSSSAMWSWTRPACLSAWFGLPVEGVLSSWMKNNAVQLYGAKSPPLHWALSCAGAGRELGVEALMLGEAPNEAHGLFACALAIEAKDPLALRDWTWWEKRFETMRETSALGAGDPKYKQALLSFGARAQARIARMEIEHDVPQAKYEEVPKLRI